MPNPESEANDGNGEYVGNWLIRRLRAWHQVLGMVEPSETPDSPYASILHRRERLNPIDFARAFKKAVRFKEIDADLITTGDPIGLPRVVNGQNEDYLTKLATERKKGQNEAVSYGIGTINKKPFAAMVFNWDFMVATSGRVVGEKFVRAMKFAEENKLPVAVLYCSGGQRQQEGVPALREMLRTVYAIEELFKGKTNLPVISALIGSTFGGISASGVPRGDVIVAEAGADFGFAGGRVIKEVEGKEPPAGAQTAENSFQSNRVVHMILRKPDELIELLDKTFSIIDEAGVLNAKPKKINETTGIDFDGTGFKTPFESVKLRKGKRAKIPIPFEPVKPDSVYNQHLVLRSDPRRPDLLYLLRHSFDGYVPYFTGRLTEDEYGKTLEYPAIVASLAYIDDPRLPNRLRMMIIGDQPSYILNRENGAIWKKHASPTAWDYRYQLKMMEFAQRLRYPATSFIDTFGARATIADELAAQYAVISDCLTAQVKFPFLTRGYIIGISGSGGGLATSFIGDYVAQLSGAEEFVAEPKSATAILYREPKEEDVIRTTEGMKPTAEFSLEMGLIDKVIPEPPGGAQNDPLAVALAIKEDLIRTQLELGGLTTEEIKARRGQRIEGSNPIPIGHLNGSKSRGIRASIRRLLGY